MAVRDGYTKRAMKKTSDVQFLIQNKRSYLVGDCIVLAILLFLTFSYFVTRGVIWNENSHLFLTSSIVDRGSLNIDPYQAFTGDKAFFNGHFYSDKAPGMSFLAIPFYYLFEHVLFHGHFNYLKELLAPNSSGSDFIMSYFIMVVCVALPSALFGTLIYRMFSRLDVSRDKALLLTLGYSLGTIAWAYSTLIFSHQITAIFLACAFFILWNIGRTGFTLFKVGLAGLLCGLAVSNEYPAAIIVAILALYGWKVLPSMREKAAFYGGMVPPLAGVVAYNILCFGSPFSSGYSHLAGPQEYQIGQSQGFMGITLPHLGAIWGITFSPFRGLFILSPFLLLTIPAFYFWYTSQKYRREFLVCLVTVLAYFLFNISYFEWNGGYSLGPRQFTPALPFLVLSLAFLPKSKKILNKVLIVLILVSVCIIALAVSTFPLDEPALLNPLIQKHGALLIGVTAQNILVLKSITTQYILSTLIKNPGVLLHSQLNNNWGMLLGLPGIIQLLPLFVIWILGIGLRWGIFAKEKDRRYFKPHKKRLQVLSKRI